MSKAEEETYSTIFAALKHPIRRKILRMLSKGAKSFSEMEEIFKIESSHLTYHLENLGDLLFKTKDGKYALSSLGEAAISMMYRVEETPKTPPRFPSLSIKWKTCFAALTVGLIFTASLYYVQYQTLSQLRNDYENAMAEIERLRGLLLIKVPSQFQNVTVHEGDITVRNNDTLLIENCEFNLTGKLIIMDGAEVIIRNSKFISNYSNYSQFQPDVFGTKHIIIRNQAKLTVLNSELIFTSLNFHPLYGDFRALFVYDHATLNMTETKITSDGTHIAAFNNSKIWIKDAAISTFTPPFELTPTPKNGLLISGQSQLEVQNSIIDWVVLGSWYFGEEANCTVTLFNSKIEGFSTDRDSSMVNIADSNMLRLSIYGPKSNLAIFNSKIGYYLSAHSESNVQLTNTAVNQLNAFGTSKVWLFNSPVKNVYKAGKPEIWVVWNLPLFGKVKVPYAWIQSIPSVTAFLIPLIALIGIIAFHLKMSENIRKREVKN